MLNNIVQLDFSIIHNLKYGIKNLNKSSDILLSIMVISIFAVITNRFCYI